MICPECGGATLVINTGSGIDEVIRQRKCKECKHIFYTAERDIDRKNAGKLLQAYKTKKS